MPTAPIKKISQNRLKKLLHYNPDTGIFTRIKSSAPCVNIGDVAGCINVSGYVSISVNGKEYYAHRLAFLYMEGYFPENDVDHINRNSSDNRWINLRHVSRSCNNINSKMDKRNTTGVTGVYWHKQCKRWEAKIGVNKNKINLGRYKNFISAVKSRWNAEKEYNFPNCNSSSSAYLFLRKEGIV